MITQYGLRQLHLMHGKIKAFEKGHLHLYELIVDLEGLVNSLNDDDKSWKDEFIAYWWDLEQAYALAIDKKKEFLDEHDVLTINKAIDDIKRLINFKIHNQFGKELKSQLVNECDIAKISHWALQVYTENDPYLNASTREILERLISMEEDPKFEFTRTELQLLADKLINDEPNPLKQVIDMKSKGLI